VLLIDYGSVCRQNGRSTYCYAELASSFINLTLINNQNKLKNIQLLLLLLLHLMETVQVNLRQLVPTWVLFLDLFWKKPPGIGKVGFFTGSMSNHQCQREHKALTLARGMTSFYLQ